jgi:hypothetical protein
MPNRWPIADGNWSNSAIWSGSIIPTASDDVFANNKTVTIDTNITVASLRVSATGSAAAGGTFLLTDNITVTAPIITSVNTANTSILQISQSNSATIIGNLTGSVRRALSLSDSSNIVITGSVVAGNGSNYHGISHDSTGNLIISGNLTGPTTAQSFAIVHTGNGNIYVTGSIYGRTTPTQGGGINSTGLGNIYVKGDVTGSFNAASYGITKTAVGIIEINGNCIPLTGSAINMTSNGVLIISGTISSSIAAPGVQSSGTNATNLFTGPFYNTGSFNAVYVYRMQMLEPASTTWTFDTETAGISKTLYTSNQLPGVPQQSDVRRGTQYNFGLTGSLEMPDPSVVQAGVAVDNTVGSAVFTAQDVFNVLTQDINVTGSIGDVLKNASSVQTMAATISTFKV